MAARFQGKSLEEKLYGLTKEHKHVLLAVYRLMQQNQVAYHKAIHETPEIKELGYTKSQLHGYLAELKLANLLTFKPEQSIKGELVDTYEIPEEALPLVGYLARIAALTQESKTIELIPDKPLEDRRTAGASSHIVQ